MNFSVCVFKAYSRVRQCTLDFAKKWISPQLVPFLISRHFRCLSTSTSDIKNEELIMISEKYLIIQSRLIYEYKTTVASVPRIFDKFIGSRVSSI